MLMGTLKMHVNLIILMLSKHVKMHYLEILPIDRTILKFLCVSLTICFVLMSKFLLHFGYYYLTKILSEQIMKKKYSKVNLL